MSDSKKTITPQFLVEQVMTHAVHRVRPEMKVHEAIELLTRHMISGAPVVDQLDTVLTVVSEGDMLRLAAQRGFEVTIGSCMDLLPKTHRLVTVEKHHTFTDAYKLFLKHTLHRIIVVDGNGRLQGLVTRADILRLFVEARYGKKINRPA
jgi:CBS domain-containing protein